MKTIVNKLRFAMQLGFVSISMTVLAQGVPYINKMSISTQMFLTEMENGISKAPNMGGDGLTFTPIHPKKFHRPIASPETINGETYISAFIRISDSQDIRSLEAIGVIIESDFEFGLLSALIPVDKIYEVAAIEGVQKVSVARLMQTSTNMARQTTNTDDVLTLSNDAINAGLPHAYDGSGVILGIIDSGIDFQHAAFKDKDGNTRIKGVYCYNGTNTTTWTGSGTLPTTDDNTGDHGTHTSSIAGGSSVIVSGSNVTVTDNHANATYGGMAPGADLYLAGTRDLQDTRIAAAMQQMYNYAASQNKPLVVSNSWGTHWGPHDGTGDVADLVHRYFGDSHPNNICLFAAGNEAGNFDPNEGGGFHVSGNASSNSPLGTIIRFGPFSDANNGMVYQGILANAWCRSANVASMGCRLLVLNVNTGAVEATFNVNPTENGAPVNGLGSYYTDGTVYAFKDYTPSGNKTQIVLYANGQIQSVDYRQTNGVYNSNYTLAVEFYPTNGSAVIDVWAPRDSYVFYNNLNGLTTNGHTWTNGSDDMTASDESTIPDVISVGAYAARTSFTNSQGQTQNYSGVLTLNDAVYFSSYATPQECPTGEMLPTITAPGARVISAVNHNHTASVDNYSYYGSNYISELVVNSSTSPYAVMDGTSMASPAAAGIVALWMQAATEMGQTLTTTDVKNIMAETAIKDSWVTSGPNATHFGNGKINALGGIEYILQEYGEPTITVSPSTVTFDGAPGGTYIETVTVGGVMLTNDIIAELNDPNGVYSINRSVNLGSGGTLTITYSPQSQGTHNATITLTSAGAPDATITINGTSREVTEATVADGTQTNSFLPIYGNQYSSRQINQMIYPANMLTDIQGKKIKSMTFYPVTPLNFYGGAFTVKMGSTTQATFPGTNYTRITGLTTVKTGQAAVRNDNLLVIEFNEPFEYTGGNLVIDFEVTATGTRSNSQNFYGINPGSYTSFNSYGNSTNNYGRYTNGSRRQFLPKVTFTWDAPYVEGNVSPTSLTFNDVAIGKSAEQTVTVSNTGTLNFTPVIDTSNLPAEFTVSNTQFLTPGNSFDLTVTYSPTDEGPHSGSFTVTIGDQTFTVTVTGNGIVVNNTLLSNEVTVPVYKTAIEVLTPYSLQDLDDDIDHSLVVDVTNSDLNIKVTRDEAITRYDVYHNADVKDNGQNWATGGINQAVSYSNVTNSNDSYVYLPYVKDEDDLTQWVQQPSVTMASGEDEMWVHLNDYVTVQNAWTWYVPVVVADGVVTTGNTYGAPIKSSRLGSVTATVAYDRSTNRTDAATNQQYYYMTAQVQIHGTAPEVDADADYHYECYKARAWRIWTPYVVGVGAQPQTETYMGEVLLSGITDDAIIGDKDFHATSTGWDLNEPVFCSPVGTEAMFVSRLYYQRVPNNSNAPRRAGGGGGGGGGGGSAPGSGPVPPSEPTGLVTYDVDKTVVGTTYVNPLGMTSDRPFEGMNIIVTRYSDGTTSIVKVFK